MRAPTLTAEFYREKQIRKALDARDNAWLKIYDNGGAKLSEMMKADFGTESPNGLDIDYWAGDREIGFQKAKVKYQGKINKFFAHVPWGSPETVEFHPILKPFKNAFLQIGRLRRNFVDMLSHEPIHSRQGIEMMYGLHQLHFGNFLSNAPKPETEEAKARSSRIERKSLVTSFGKYNVAGYLDSQVEIQARMHEIVSKAYHDWGKMPTSPEEFIAAMHHVGIKVPSELVSDLHKTHEGRRALDEFQINPLTKGNVKRPVKLLNRVNDYANVCNTPAQTWKDEHMSYYGGLLELYGDKEGCARMFKMESFHEVKTALKAAFDCEELGDKEIAEICETVPDTYIPGFLISLSYHEGGKETVAAFAQELKDQGKEIPPEAEELLQKQTLTCE